MERRLGLVSAAAVVVGSTIGSGIFRSPAEIAGHVPALAPFIAVWIVGGLVALCGALSLAELSAAMPATGGLYVYLREAYGRAVAFLFGWAELVVLRPAAYGAIALISAEYTWRALDMDPAETIVGTPVSRAQALAIVWIVLLGLNNIRGLRWAEVVQNVSTLLKLVALVTLVVLVLALAPTHPLAPAQTLARGRSWTATSLAAALVGVMWAYDGWADLGFVAGEVRDPGRTLPRALILGTAVVAATYLVVNAAYLVSIPVEDMPGRTLIAADVAAQRIGPWGQRMVSAAIAVSTFGTLNGSLMTGPRVFQAMAADRVFFPALSAIHPRWRTPSRAIALSIGLGIAFVSVRTFGQLADQFVIGIWPFYALGVAAVLVLRRTRADLERPHRVLWFPLPPLVFLAATALLLLGYSLKQPLTVLANAGVVALGVPIYAIWSRARSSAPAGA